jgi:hypothetical protein
LQEVSFHFCGQKPAQLAAPAAARLANRTAASVENSISDACQCRDAETYQDCFFHDKLILAF